MTPKHTSVLISATFVLLLGIFSISALAQHEEKMQVGKKGNFVFSSETRVGDAVLPKGAYQFQHIVQGDDHVFVFKRAADGRAVARVKCAIEPLGEKAKQTLISSTTNAAGEKVVTRIVVEGENVEHVF